jgi:histidinol dehydrogenase
VKLISTVELSFNAELKRIQDRDMFIDKAITQTVREIVENVAIGGDRALFGYTEKYDGIVLDPQTVKVTEHDVEEAFRSIDNADLEILKLAAQRIEAFHKKQRINSWIDSDEEGIELGQLIRPLNRVGIYAPGGRASYPSTVLMAAIPAGVAGVSETILVTPAEKGTLNPLVLAAAQLAGIDTIFKVGGAQAVAALAYGTESIPRVDKIVGPGNVYVATAKKMVYGQVGIDMIAGPSEIVIISDGTVSPAIVAADLLSQAEHDEMACALLLTPERSFAESVVSEVISQIPALKRKSIVSRAIKEYGAAIVTRNMEEAIDIANRFAPEHLELMVEKPRELLDKIKNAGAIFLGYSSPEAVGDYMAGPNHILPTGGTARFSSPLGVYDFMKRTSVISFSEKSLMRYGHKVARFAELEGLDAHRKSITVRFP